MQTLLVLSVIVAQLWLLYVIAKHKTAPRYFNIGLVIFVLVCYLLLMSTAKAGDLYLALGAGYEPSHEYFNDERVRNKRRLEYDNSNSELLFSFEVGGCGEKQCITGRHVSRVFQSDDHGLDFLHYRRRFGRLNIGAAYEPENRYFGQALTLGIEQCANWLCFRADYIKGDQDTTFLGVVSLLL